MLICSVSKLLELSEFRFRAFGPRFEASAALERVSKLLDLSEGGSGAIGNSFQSLLEPQKFFLEFVSKLLELSELVSKPCVCVLFRAGLLKCTVFACFFEPVW